MSMVPPFVRLFIVLQGLLLSSFNIFSQNNPQDDASATQEKYSLFASDEVLQLKISGNLNAYLVTGVRSTHGTR